MVYSSGYWKKQAREALQNHWLTALLIALIVELPGLLVQGIATVTGNDLMIQVQDALYSSLSAGGANIDMQQFALKLEAIQGMAGVWWMQGLNIAVWLLVPCLGLGQLAWMTGRLRKEEDPGVKAVFSRVKLFWKAIGLRLYTAWRVFLFMLPGVALSVLAMLPLWLSDGSSRISVLSAANTAIGLEYAAMVVTFILGIIGTLKYALGGNILADHPDQGPIQAAKASKQMTRGRKGALASLYVSFLFWYLLEMVAATVTLDLAGSVVSLMVQLLASLAITVYVRTSVTAFYLGCCRPQEQEAAAEEASEIPAEGELF